MTIPEVRLKVDTEVRLKADTTSVGAETTNEE